jgi:protein-S-isoprenylcysteine O-methyltransferase Ste14
MRSSIRLLLVFVGVTLVFFLVLPLVILFAIQGLNSLLSLPPFPSTPCNYVVAVPIFAFGWFWVAWSNLYLLGRGRGTSLEVAGRGVDVTKELVVTGPYAYVRNPMVFGYFVAFGMGLGALVHSLAAGFAVCALGMLLYTVYLKKWEEKGLEARFGEIYVRYRKRVPMLIPVPWRRYKVPVRPVGSPPPSLADLPNPTMKPYEQGEEEDSMRKLVLTGLLLLSWILCALAIRFAWGTIRTIQLDQFVAGTWGLALLLLNWIGINLILTYFFFADLPEFVEH